MKKIKLIILGLLLSTFMYGQDTLTHMIAGKNLLIFSKPAWGYITYSSNDLQKGDYEDQQMSIDYNQTLLLHLYDACEVCDKSIKERIIIYELRDGSIKKERLKSSMNVYYVNGDLVSKVTVKKP